MKLNVSKEYIKNKKSFEVKTEWWELRSWRW